MTIAAGFLNQDGVLLASDTLMTDGFTASYRSKIIPIYFADGEIIFAFCGTAAFADSVVQRCQDLFHTYKGPQRSIAQIIQSVRKQWLSMFRELHGSNITDVKADQIICAVHSKRDKTTKLCWSSNENLAESVDGVSFIGSGSETAKYVVGSHFPFSSTGSLSRRRTFEIAINAVSRVKQFMPTAVGGNLIAINLNHDGSELVYGQTDIERIESHTKDFDDITREMIINLMDYTTDPGGFNEEFDRLSERIKGIRFRWEMQLSDAARVDIPPIEITHALWNGQEDWRKAQSAQ